MSNWKRIGLSLASLLVTALIVTACGQTTAAPGASLGDLVPNEDGYVDINVEQYAALVEEQDPLLVNVHIPFAGDIPGTDLSIPYNEIADNLDKLPDKDAPIVLYCRSGGMSTAAAKELVGLGYTNVYELDGGMNAWTDAGNELVGQ